MAEKLPTRDCGFNQLHDKKVTAIRPHLKSSASWLDKNKAVQKFTLNGSHLLGNLLVRVLRCMFPNQYKALKARDGHETMVLPVVRGLL